MRFVNAEKRLDEDEALQGSLRRGTPFGVEGWVHPTVERLGLEITLRPRGRPKKPKEKGS